MKVCYRLAAGLKDPSSERRDADHGGSRSYTAQTRIAASPRASGANVSRLLHGLVACHQAIAVGPNPESPRRRSSLSSQARKLAERRSFPGRNTGREGQFLGESVRKQWGFKPCPGSCVSALVVFGAVAMTKGRPPRPFRRAEDTASATEAAQLLTEEFSRTVAVLRRHHSIDAAMVVIVRDPLTQHQASISTEVTPGLEGLTTKYKLTHTAAVCAAEHALMSEARALTAQAEPRRLAQLPDRARAHLLDWLLCQAVRNRQGLGWRYGHTELALLQASVSSWPDDLPYISPGQLTTAQQSVLLSVLTQHLLSQQQQAAAMERARRELPGKMGSDQQLALAVLETAFGAEPRPRMTGSEGRFKFVLLAWQLPPAASHGEMSCAL